MTNITDLTAGQLHRILAIKEQIEALQSQIDSIAGADEVPIPSPGEALAPAKRKYHMTADHRRKLIKALARARKIRAAKLKGARATFKLAKKGKRRLSAAGRAAIIAGTKARWARVKGEKATPEQAEHGTKKDRRSSPAVRAKLAAAARARWARVKAEGKTTL